MNSKKIKGNIMLLLTAVIWGAAFVAQDKGMDYISPFTFNGIRMILGGITLLPVIMVTQKTQKPVSDANSTFRLSRQEITGGIFCGIALFAASSFQQFGMALYDSNAATAGKGGFLSALYVVFVPVLGLFLKKKVPASAWISVVIALLGMYLLCIKGTSKMSVADLLLCICAVFFAVHILVIDRYSPSVNGIKLSAVQFFVCGGLSVICALIFDPVQSLNSIISAAVPILYTGCLSSGVAYTLQVVAQKYTSPSAASLILSLESVFAALFGAVFGERLSAQELLGCALVFAAVIISQIKYSDK